MMHGFPPRRRFLEPPVASSEEASVYCASQSERALSSISFRPVQQSVGFLGENHNDTINRGKRKGMKLNNLQS